MAKGTTIESGTVDGQRYKLWQSNRTKKQYVFIDGNKETKSLTWLNGAKRDGRVTAKADRFQEGIFKAPVSSTWKHPHTWPGIKARIFDDIGDIPGEQ